MSDFPMITGWVLNVLLPNDHEMGAECLTFQWSKGGKEMSYFPKIRE